MFWKGVVIGFFAAVGLLAIGAYCYFGLGLAPVATAAQPMPFEKFLASRALHAVIRRTADRPPPVEATEANLKKGAGTYRMECAGCHGLPDKPINEIAKGMFPKPPQLFAGKGVTDDPVGETYWKVENGIRLSGMPAFKGSLSEDEIWQVSLLLANADKLPATARSELIRKD